ncbi:hypothetical protein [Stenotrophomonas sp. PS02297]|uniref:hypothetical protein n=1 Tax=Stenotrophomonas sp. PS02297 TaxID=2991423 RepID=UPI002499E706|nr:hypothetical protein [Stenotrophomonas sp. PS02297]
MMILHERTSGLVQRKVAGEAPWPAKSHPTAGRCLLASGHRHSMRHPLSANRSSHARAHSMGSRILQKQKARPGPGFLFQA